MGNGSGRSTTISRPRPRRGNDVQYALKFREHLRENPDYFVGSIIGDDPWDMQTSILRAIARYRRVCVRSCHGIGKTRLLAWAALWFLFSFANSRVITTAPTFQQVENLLWRDLRVCYNKALVNLGGRLLTTRLEVGDDWFAVGLSTEKDTDKFQGQHAKYSLFLVDEAAGVDERIFTGIESSITGEFNKLLLVGNPTALAGTFYQAFRDVDYKKFKVPYFETPNFQGNGVVRPYLVTPLWVDERKKKWGEDSPLFMARALAEFPEVGDDTLIHLRWVEDALTRAPEPGESNELGVDVARFGSDETVIAHRRGTAVRIALVLNGCDTMRTAGEVARLLRETGASVAKIDTVGIGAGVYDRLKELNFPVVEMIAGARASDDDQYVNASSEWWWNAREMFREGKIALEHDDLACAQLSARKYKFDSRGRIVLESKDEMKKRGLDSPDRADAIILALAPQGFTPWQASPAWL